MQQALSHSNVRTIVDILLQHREVLSSVADILQRFVRPAEPGLPRALAGMRALYSRLDEEENSVVPEYITILIETLERMYHQNFEKIKDQRGAVVELFGRKLVCPRYDNKEDCFNGGKLKDDQGQFITIQEVDVAALSDQRRQVEGYECKLKADGLESDDCTDLAHLIKAAQENGYRANAGIVSFDIDNRVRRKLDQIRSALQHLPTVNNIEVYGLNSIETLQKPPF
jgi:hypothetical protein